MTTAKGCIKAQSSILGEETFETTNVFTLDIMFGHWLIAFVSLVSLPIASDLMTNKGNYPHHD